MYFFISCTQRCHDHHTWAIKSYYFMMSACYHHIIRVLALNVHKIVFHVRNFVHGEYIKSYSNSVEINFLRISQCSLSPLDTWDILSNHTVLALLVIIVIPLTWVIPSIRGQSMLMWDQIRAEGAGGVNYYEETYWQYYNINSGVVVVAFVVGYKYFCNIFHSSSYRQNSRRRESTFLTVPSRFLKM